MLRKHVAQRNATREEKKLLELSIQEVISGKVSDRSIKLSTS
nr:hypothetical protein [Okeania sp. SIO2F4]